MVKQSFIMTIGTIFNSLLGLLFYVLVAKNLGVEKFGHFSYLLGLGLLAAELGDLGINSAIVKFGSGDRFSAIFSFAIVQRIIIFVPIIMIFFFLGLLPSAMITIGLLLGYLATQSLLARQKFGLQVFANVFGNLVRLVLLVTTPFSAIAIFFLGTLATFIMGMVFIVKEFKRFTFGKAFTTEVLRFSLPAAGSFSLSAIASKADVPILYSLAGPMAVGIYSSAQKLVSVLPQIASAIDSVFAPKFSQKSPRAFRQYLTLAGLASLGLLIFTPFSGVLMTLIFGNKYLGSETVFKILLLSFIPFFLSGPFLGKILYERGETKYLLLISVVNLVVSLTGLIVLIGIFQANGAALTFLIANTVALVSYVFISFVFRHKAL